MLSKKFCEESKKSDIRKKSANSRVLPLGAAGGTKRRPVYGKGGYKEVHLRKRKRESG